MTIPTRREREARVPAVAGGPAFHPAERARFYEAHLREQVMPFWLRHGMDPACGGIRNAIDSAGRRHSEEKFTWSQGRALWTFSALHNDLDPDGRWLPHAHHIARFLKQHAPAPGEPWPYTFTREGAVQQAARSVYADAFAIQGLTEYHRATGDEEALALAVRSARRILPLLDDHSRLPTAPHQIPAGAQSHGPTMIFALVFHELGLQGGGEAFAGASLALAEKIMREHVDTERQVLREFVHPGGGWLDSDAGHTFIPGHAIESMWFLERIFRHHDRRDRLPAVMDVMRWSMERGWDDVYGGLFLAGHLTGGPPVWHEPTAKVWWPHVEALYGLLLAYIRTGDPCFLDWHGRVHDYAFARFPNRDHGDWNQNLDRAGRPISVVVKGLSVKDPFHLPRALLYGRNLAAAYAQGDPHARNKGAVPCCIDA